MKTTLLTTALSAFTPVSGPVFSQTADTIYTGTPYYAPARSYRGMGYY
jgi:hypothetical protein